jgi:hypothetical protein
MEKYKCFLFILNGSHKKERLIVVYRYTHELYRHQSKMSSSKKLTGKVTLQQVFIRVYRLEIQSVMLVFSTQLCELLPL